MNKVLVWVVGLIVLVAVGYAGVRVVKHYTKATPAQPAAVAPTEAVTSPSASPSSAMAATEVTVEGNEFAFTPSTIAAKMGDTLKVTFKNTGKYPHNFTVSDLNVKTKTIQPGESDTVEFTVAKAGSFKYICTVDSHADKGMTGILTVK